MFNAVILAGERPGSRGFAQNAGVPLKALIPIDESPMVARVAGALLESGYVDRIALCGPDRDLFAKHWKEMRQLMEEGRVVWLDSERGPSQSAYKALSLLGGQRPILLTTADHALLSGSVVSFFCKRALEADCDLAVALTRLDRVKEAYPAAERTSYRFREGRFCSCNLFGFMNQGAFKAAEFWVQLEEKRKSPVKVIGGFGWYWAVKYVLGLLSLSEAFVRASEMIGCRALPIELPFPEAAIDVDDQADLEMVRKILSRREKE